MSVPTRVKTQPTMPPPPTAPGLAPTTSRGGVPVTTMRPPSTPPLPDLIQQQPLPDPMTAQYQQQLAMYQQQLAQLQGTYGPAMQGMQNQINQMTLAAGNNPMQRLLMAQYQGDPYADLRAQQLRMERGNPRLSMAYYVGDWGGY